jgi:hypothetical protein
MELLAAGESNKEPEDSAMSGSEDEYSLVSVTELIYG